MESNHLTKNKREVQIKYPYCDWRKVMEITPATKRYAACIDSFLPGSEFYSPEEGFDENHQPYFETARWMAVQRLKEIFTKYHYTAKSISEETGIDRALFAHMFSDNRYFSAPATSLEALSNFTFISSHELLFGEKGKVVLPKRYNFIVNGLQLLPESDFHFLSKLCKKHYTDYSSAEEITPLHHRSSTSLLLQRLSCLKEDNMLTNIGIFGRMGETPYQFKYMLSLLWDESRQYMPKMPFLMYAAMSTGLALDFFVCEKFDKYVPIFYKDENSTEKQILDPAVLEFISDLMALDPPREQIILATAMVKIIQADINRA